MKQYYKLLVFITALASITSVAFILMDVLFSEKIEQNQNAANYEAMLIHNGTEFTDQTLFTVFDEVMQVESYTYNGKTVKIYTNQVTQNISFLIGIFDAAGVWGDIVGVMTVDPNFETIINVTVLQNEEQLGKDVATRGFLDQFVGLKLDVNSLTPVIIGPIGPEGDLYNEVDQLAGATGTSNGFQLIINESYFIYTELLESGAAS